MNSRLANILGRASDWLFGSDVPLVTRVFVREFCDRSSVRLTLSTRRPRYCAEFSEPPHPATLTDEFFPWRNERLAAFQKATGIEFSKRELGNEISRPIPRVSRMEIEERKRQEQIERRRNTP